MWGVPAVGKGPTVSTPVGSKKAGDQGLARALSCERRKGKQLWYQLRGSVPGKQLAKDPQLRRTAPDWVAGAQQVPGLWISRELWTPWDLNKCPPSKQLAGPPARLVSIKLFQSGRAWKEVQCQ